MTKPIVTNPDPNKTPLWHHKRVIAQGIYNNNLTNLRAYLKRQSDGTVTKGKQVPSRSPIWVFDFENQQEDDYTLFVSEIVGGDCCDPVKFTVIFEGAFADPNILWPGSGDSVTQSFAAWGTSNNNLTVPPAAPQTMVGYDGGGAETDGTVQQQPSNANGHVWIVQFAITDAPLQNTYTMTITSAVGGHTAQSTRITVGPNSSGA